MGAAVSIELQKPTDASDIIQSGKLEDARNEVMRLRADLGHLAKSAGFADVVYDASDLCLGINEDDDFKRCIKEIIHIRTALQLSTQQSRRQTRHYTTAPFNIIDQTENEDEDESSNEESEANSSKSEQLDDST
jgi:hypothetical protein